MQPALCGEVAGTQAQPLNAGFPRGASLFGEQHQSLGRPLLETPGFIINKSNARNFTRKCLNNGFPCVVVGTIIPLLMFKGDYICVAFVLLNFTY